LAPPKPYPLLLLCTRSALAPWALLLERGHERKDLLLGLLDQRRQGVPVPLHDASQLLKPFFVPCC
jgi:hypothetical protein